MWPVDEMGKNSVIPSTIPKMIACKLFMINIEGGKDMREGHTSNLVIDQVFNAQGNAIIKIKLFPFLLETIKSL